VGPADGPDPTRNLFYCFYFFSKEANLNCFNSCLLELENFQIKYGFEGFEVRNNFPYWNFSRFKTNFELKFKEASRV
jgi:hypothetical protein